jgi:hypothetical protein
MKELIEQKRREAEFSEEPGDGGEGEDNDKPEPHEE